MSFTQIEIASSAPTIRDEETDVHESESYTAARKFHLFGYPISHSFSPLVHRTVFEDLSLPWTYTLDESTDLSAFLSMVRDPLCYGSAVTMPHKVAILPHLDELTEEAREVGACNTIFVREDVTKDGKMRKVYVGTNTDVVGVREALLQNVKDPDATLYNRPALVIGGGGAARSAVYALHKWLHATRIYIVNRDPLEVDAVIAECTARGYGSKLVHVYAAEDAERLEAPGAVVACVPDFPPLTDGEKEARRVTEIFLQKTEKGAWLEMAYHPTVWTSLARLARDCGWQVVIGTEAMIWQGLEQDRLWTGREVDKMPVERVKQLVNEAVSKVNEKL